MAIGQELLNVPMGDMIRQMAFAIADAQFALDESSMRVAEMMSGQYPLRDEDGNLVDGDGNLLVGDDGKLSGDPVYLDSRVYFGTPVKGDDGKLTAPRLSMMELGFTPTFYQFIDTIIEVKIAIRITREHEFSKKTQVKTANTKIATRLRSGLVKTKMNVSTTTVDAAYSSKYSYSAEGSSLLRTKLVPVPPPTVLEDRIRRLFDEQQAAAEPPPPPKE